ncbi:DUF2721 domain-containing protein [Bosea sp. RAF48]|uniref:DUF2721 domain-containing protein n=1 Tax=Bosea sp. RAF48 TaxID=3237480 RepID=UPI003F8ECD1B
MLPNLPSVSHLSVVITQAAAPAFLLGAVVGLISVLINRLERILDRSRMLNGLQKDGAVAPELRADLPRLEERAALINSAIFLAISSGVSTILLMALAFGLAFAELPHERGVALLFIGAVGLFGASLTQFLREVRIALRITDHLR